MKVRNKHLLESKAKAENYSRNKMRMSIGYFSDLGVHYPMKRHKGSSSEKTKKENRT